MRKYQKRWTKIGQKTEFSHIWVQIEESLRVRKIDKRVIL